MNKLRNSMLPLLLCTALLGMGCGSDGTIGTVMYPDGAGGDGSGTLFGDGTGGPDATGGDTGTATGGEDTAAGGTDTGVAPSNKELRFAMPNGNKDDFGGVCADACKLNLPQNSVRKIYVQYLVDGQPKADVLVRFAKIDPSNSAVDVLIENVFTDENGMAMSELKAGGTPGTIDIAAVTPDDESIGARVFGVHVISKAKGPLQIRLTYKGSSNQLDLVHLKARLTRQETAGQPACKDIDLGDVLPKAQWESPGNLQWDKPWTITYPAFAKWVEKEVGDNGGNPVTFTVIGVAAKSNVGATRAAGCVDTGASVTWNPGTKAIEGSDVTVLVKDLPPRIKGSYDMVTHLDLLSILPDKVEFVFKAVFDILTDPIAGTLSLACSLGNGKLDSFCGLIFEDVKKPDIKNLKQPFGALIVKFLDGILYGYLPANVKTGLNTGADLGKILTNLEMGGVITLKKEPDSTGFLPKDQTKADWQSVTYKWSLGQACNPNDPNCGKKTFSFVAFQQEAIVGSFDLWRDAIKSEIKIGEHGLTVKWGALLNYIIQKQLLPVITADPKNPAAPVVDSYEKLVKSLLGGKQCLIKDTCCADFGKQLAAKQTLVTETFLAGTCDLLVKLGAGYIESQLTSLDTSTGKGNTMTLKTEGCAVFDDNQDMVIDSIGKSTYPCDWNMQVKIGGKSQKVKATFYATRQE
ncbi:MAG: hypothetical protein KC502_00460 [Myxococcales bacterium]|nr:hypothetical protein [Myxococcales bacterium]